MVTDISVHETGNYFAEDRSWAIGEHGFDAPQNVVLDLTLFTGTNFADGYIKSGTILAKVTAVGANQGKVGPYTTADSTTGLGVAVGVLFNTVKIGTPTTRLVADAVLVHFVCRETRLPYSTGDGSIDATGKADLPLVIWN